MVVDHIKMLRPDWNSNPSSRRFTMVWHSEETHHIWGEGCFCRDSREYFGFNLEMWLLGWDGSKYCSNEMILCLCSSSPWKTEYECMRYVWVYVCFWPSDKSTVLVLQLWSDLYVQSMWKQAEIKPKVSSSFWNSYGNSDVCSITSMSKVYGKHTKVKCMWCHLQKTPEVKSWHTQRLQVTKVGCGVGGGCGGRWSSIASGQEVFTAKWFIGDNLKTTTRKQ